MSARLKLALFIISSLAVLFLIGVGLYFAFGRSTSPQETNPSIKTVYVDKDTGEEIESYSNLVLEMDGSPSILLLGLEPILRNLVGTQPRFVRDSLYEYSDLVLKNKFSVLAFIPDTYYRNDSVIGGVLRLGEGDDKVNLTVTKGVGGSIRVQISDEGNKHGGSYDSGVKTFDQP